ncbi:MAG: hypothetical protein RSB28_05490, partial [Oscillospiraceae bacterium]
LAPFKESLSIFYMTECNSPVYRQALNLPREEHSELIRKNISVVIDFYDRFILTMENMMRNAKGYTLISFMGP